MIEPGDRVAVGLSGGKDSAVLLYALARYKNYTKRPFSLLAVTIDPVFGGEPADYGELARYCESLGVEHVVKRTNIGEVVFEQRREKNPCSLCARMRRGALHDVVVARGFNKLALGHHMDDAVETFFLNLFHEGRLGAFQPVTYLSRKDITMIRPLILCAERDVAAATRRETLPVVKSRCPADGNTERERIKEFCAEMESRHRGFLRRTFGAMQRGDLSGLRMNAPEKDE